MQCQLYGSRSLSANSIHTLFLDQAVAGRIYGEEGLMRHDRSGWLAGTALAVLCAVCAYAASTKRMSVQVQTAHAREKPSFLGKVTAALPYGERVEVLDEKDGWARVRTGAGREGWVHGSALTKKKIVLRAGAADVKAAASDDEMALAGKGFNSDVEAEFKAKNRNIDFAGVDRMREAKVSPEEMREFLAEGGLLPQGEAR